MDVRPAANLEEFRAGLHAIGHFFGWEPDEESAERFSHLLPVDRCLSRSKASRSSPAPARSRRPSQAEQTDDPADLRLDVSALGSACLGGVTFGELLRAGRIEELRRGAAARAEAMFRTARAPWWTEIF